MTRFGVLPVPRAAADAGGESNAAADPAAKDAAEILAVERAAFERWVRGDPEGFLEASDPEVSYFDPFVEVRLDGLAALRALYMPLQGTIQADRWEMINPQVVVSGDMGLLTFNFESCGKGRTVRWNTTEVYRRKQGQWKIVHTHWALTQPKLAEPLL